MYLGLLALHTTVCGLVSCRFCSLPNALFGGDDWLAFHFKSLFGAERKIVEIERSHGFDFLLQHFHTWDGPPADVVLPGTNGHIWFIKNHHSGNNTFLTIGFVGF